MARRISAPAIAGSSNVDNSFGITDGVSNSCCSCEVATAEGGEVLSVGGESLGACDDSEAIG